MSPGKLHSCLAAQIQNFIHLRRLSGTDYQSQAQLLGYFDRFLLEQKLSEPRITREITDGYQKSLSHLAPRSRYNRFCVVRQLGEYLARSNPFGYVPEPMRIIPSPGAHQPYIYSHSELQALLAAASQLPPPNSLRPPTYRTLLGVLYSTGIRIGEALALNLEDFHSAEQRLYIAEGKFRKARWVPLSTSTCRALQQYLRQRLRIRPCSPDSPLLLNQRSRRPHPCTVHQTFQHLLSQCGIRHHKHIGPRIHDLRHTFAVHRLLAWYRDRQDVNARLPALATYMGHVDVRSTQVYLRPTAELLAEVNHRFHHHYLHNVNPPRRKIMNHPLATFMKRFFSHYLPVQKGLSVNTVRAYRDAVKLLLCYATDTLRKPVDELAVEDLIETLVLGFLDQVEQVRGCSPRTRNARLAAIRTLFAFLAREKPFLMLQCQQVRTIPLKRIAPKTIDYFEEKEMQAVFTAIDVNSRTGIRDRALLLLLYNTGARVSEIVALKLTDLRLDDSAQVKLLGKGKKERSCPLWPETVVAVEAYLKQRDPLEPGSERLFLNANGSPLTRFGIRHITCKYGAQVQAQQPSVTPKPLNPHTIRHTTAMHLLRAGNDINMVSYWLGHADINTTHIYVEIDMETKRKMIDKAGAPTISKQAPWQQPHVLQWLNNLARDCQLCAVNY